MPSGGSIQQAANAAPAGATICLSGVYDVVEVQPKSGQTFQGPATIRVGGVNGFALKLANARNVTLIDLDISGASDQAVECWVGLQVIGGRLHHNGDNGMGCGLQYERGHILVDGVEIDNNGDPSGLGQGAGGIKVARLGPDGMTIRNSHIHHNIGNGVWCDVQCIGTWLIESNEIDHNHRKGVHYEKSGATDEMSGPGQVCLGCGLPVVEGQMIVRFNLVHDNGREGREHAADGGITAVSSRNVHIHDNVTFGTPRGGIHMRQDGRLSGEKHGWTVQALIENNQAADGIIGCDLNGVTCRNNTT